MIRLVDRILNVEHGRDGHRDPLAILDRHGAVLTLAHDLQRQSVLARKMNPHEAEADATQHRLHDQRDARIDAALADDAIVTFACQCRHAVPVFCLASGG